jgi:hypothetical protein
MRMLGDAFVMRWRDRMMNIHPSLLPAFKGLKTHDRVLAAGARFTGCTVHFVRPAMDEGPIIVQSAVAVLPGDDAARLAERVLAEEHKAYPLALRLVAEGRVTVREERVEISGAIAPRRLRSSIRAAETGSCQRRTLRYRSRGSRARGAEHMAVDQELERHRQTWLNFTRLMKWSIVLIILALVLLRLLTL